MRYTGKYTAKMGGKKKGWPKEEEFRHIKLVSLSLPAHAHVTCRSRVLTLTLFLIASVRYLWVSWKSHIKRDFTSLCITSQQKSSKRISEYPPQTWRSKFTSCSLLRTMYKPRLHSLRSWGWDFEKCQGNQRPKRHFLEKPTWRFSFKFHSPLKRYWCILQRKKKKVYPFLSTSQKAEKAVGLKTMKHVDNGNRITLPSQTLKVTY